MAEAGVSGMEIPVWTAFFAPANTPRPIIERLQKEVARAVHTPEVKERFAQMGVDPVGSTPEELAVVVSRDLQRYIAVAQRANIKND
jgi:tripartite-type tricarboxylate transporter receptor subunit TctC